MKYNDNITVTDFNLGPFCVVVTDPNNPNDDAFPYVITMGIAECYDTAAIVRWIEDNFAKRAVPYLGLRLSIVPERTPRDFVGFCSWED
jgi:hypothetical protein